METVRVLVAALTDTIRGSRACSMALDGSGFVGDSSTLVAAFASAVDGEAVRFPHHEYEVKSPPRPGLVFERTPSCIESYIRGCQHTALQ